MNPNEMNYYIINFLFYNSCVVHNNVEIDEIVQNGKILSKMEENH